MTDHVETVLHLKKKLDKGVSFEKTMHILYKLQKIPISIKLLEETGIGFKVRELSKLQKNNDIGKTAKLLTMAWKDWVRNRQIQMEANGGGGGGGQRDGNDQEDDDDESSAIEEAHDESPNQRQQQQREYNDNYHNNNNGYSSPPHQQHLRSSNHHNASYYSPSNNNNGNNYDNEVTMTPQSERSEESLNNSGGSSGHKKKHKKKKKKSSNREFEMDNSDNDNCDNNDDSNRNHSSSSKKKDKKKRYRDDNDDSDNNNGGAASGHHHQHNHNHSKHKRLSEQPSSNNNCDTSVEYNSPKLHSSSSRKSLKQNSAAAPPPPLPPPVAKQNQECDIFGALLGMNDQMIMNKNSSSGQQRKLAAAPYVPVPVIARSSSSSAVRSSTTSSSASYQPSSSANGNRHQYSTLDYSSHNSSRSSSSSSPVKPQQQSTTNNCQTSSLSNDRFDILKSLPDPNYRPPPQPIVRRDDYNNIQYNSLSSRPTQPDSAKLNAFLLTGMKMKGRTAVFAGSSKHTTTVPEVFPLHDLCIRVLMNHIDRIYEVGDLPYFILKPVLQKCTVQQLRRIEYYNPQLLEDSDELWEEICGKEFKNRHVDDSNFDTWREFHQHLTDEREQKLKNITRNISSKQRKAIPERTTQQIELKTPREVRRKQERSGISFFNSRPSGGGGNRSSGLGTSGYGSSSSGSAITIVNAKPKTAPLMKKLLQFRKGKFNRK